MSHVPQILNAIEQGDPHAAEQLAPLVDDELRTLAAQKMAWEVAGRTLQPTALVREAYLRLMPSPGRESGGPPQRWNSRGHFFAAAAEAMRRILVERARSKHRIKRDRGARRVEFDEDLLIFSLTEGVRQCQFATNSYSVASVQTSCNHWHPCSTMVAGVIVNNSPNTT
jgi:RNA polymerase sigma factor (TIGR02999 family)